MIRGITFADQLTTSDDFAHLQYKWFNSADGSTTGCKVTADADNLYVGAGYFLIRGRLVRIVGTETIASDVVSAKTYCKLVFEIDLSKVNTTTIFTQGYFKIISSTSGYPKLTQEDLDNGGLVYQLEFARFVKTTTSITEFKSTIPSINIDDVWSDYFENKKTEIDNVVGDCIDELNSEVAKVQDGSLVSYGEFTPTVTHSIYKSNQDDNGLYTTVTYKRADGTTYKVSELSNADNDGNYGTQTITYYEADGSTVDKTEVYAITYNSDGDVESEVLTNA